MRTALVTTGEEAAPSLDCALSVLHRDRPKVVNAGVAEWRQVYFNTSLRQVSHFLILGAPLAFLAK